MTAQLDVEAPHIPALHRERFMLAERPENQGEAFRPSDYGTLVMATLVVPLLMVVLAWFA
jgi:hypothetical protein